MSWGEYPDPPTLGEVMDMPPQRALNRILTNTVKDSDTGCRLWLGSHNNHGYPRMGRTYVHRIVVELVSGPIPEGYHVHHKCGNSSCVSPNHLERSDARQNIGEMLVRKSYERYIEALREVVRELSPGHPVLAERAETFEGK